MVWLVAKYKAPAVRGLDDYEVEVMRADRINSYFTREDTAKKAAENLASDNPGVQYAVFGVLNIYETLPPAKPKVIHKVINEHGEVVMAEKA